MITIADILSVIDAYLSVSSTSAQPVHEKTLSGRIFGDQKKIAIMRAGGDITVTRANNALIWLSQNWEAEMVWPPAVPRPALAEVA